mgnify:CR=1 FL=1
MRRGALLTVLTVFAAAPALAQEATVLQLVSVHDPAAADPSVCSIPGAPGTVRLVLGGTFSSVRTEASSGKVNDAHPHTVGTGTACIDVPVAHLNPASFFPIGEHLTIYGDWHFGRLHMAGEGRCTYQTNDLPVPGVVLTGCTMEITDAPEGYLGGLASSNSVFNPLSIPGYSTGSFWTFRLFHAPEPEHAARSRHHRR